MQKPPSHIVIKNLQDALARLNLAAEIDFVALARQLIVQAVDLLRQAGAYDLAKYAANDLNAVPDKPETDSTRLRIERRIESLMMKELDR